MILVGAWVPRANSPARGKPGRAHSSSSLLQDLLGLHSVSCSERNEHVKARRLLESESHVSMGVYLYVLDTL